jgi:hypothetical protein
VFTRAELFEYFADRYKQSSIERALEELAKFDESVDSGTLEFPDQITEQLETVFDTIEATITGQKSLSGKSLTVHDCATIAAQSLQSQHHITIPVESLAYLVQAAILDIRESARIITEASKVAFTQEIDALRAQLIKEIIKTTGSNAAQIKQAFSPQGIQKMVNAVCQPVESFDLKAFLSEMQQERVLTSNFAEGTFPQQDLTATEPRFDLDKFLEEVIL